jgi:adenylate cyclase
VVFLALVVGYLLLYRLVSDERALQKIVVKQAPSVPTVAVLPFVNLSSDPEQAYFSDGISEDILNSLVGLQRLKVTSRTSSFAFRGGDVDVPTIASTLNVQYLVEGSIRKSGNMVRINVQLIDAESDTPLWSKLYDRQLSNIFVIQSDISASIAEALQLELLGDVGNAETGGADVHLEGYDHYLRGLRLLRQSSFNDLRQARFEFEEAIRLSPDLVAAQAGLARTLVFSVLTGIAEPALVLPVAERAAYRALAQDPDFGGADAALGGVAYLRSNLYRSHGEFSRARRLGALVDTDHWLYTNALVDAGRINEAREILAESLQVNPLSSSVHWGQGVLSAASNHPEESLAAFATSLKLVPSNPNVLWLQGLVAGSMQGKISEAIKYTRDAAEADPMDHEIITFLAIFHLNLEDYETAAGLLDQAISMAPHAAFPRSAEVLLASARGNTERAALLSTQALDRFSNFRHGSDRVFLAHLPAGPEDVGSSAESYLMQLNPALTGLNTQSSLYSATVLGAYTPLAQLAVDLAHVYAGSGQHEKAARIASLVSTAVSPAQYWQFPGYQLLEAELLALGNDHEAVLTALEHVVESGYLYGWQWRVRDNSHFAAVAGTERFEKLVSVLEQRAAAERASLVSG